MLKPSQQPQNIQLNSDKPKLQITSLKSIWTIDPLHGTEADSAPEMVEMRPIILERDNHTCQFCGFHSHRHLEIHHIDHNHKNFDSSNLITACPLCHQVFHLPTVGTLYGGEMMWMPEVPQEFINIFCINLFFAMNDRKLQEVANTIYSEFKKRVEFVNNRIGRRSANFLPTSDPGVFAEAIISLEGHSDHETIMNNIHNNFRILPNRNRILTQLSAWEEERKVSQMHGDDQYFMHVKNKLDKMYKELKEREPNF